MKKIVVGFNASEEAQDALSLGDDLRKATGATLIVVIVDELQVVYGYPTVTPDLRDEFYKAVFDEAAKALGCDDFKRRTAVSSAPHGLIEIAEDEGADVILVGSTSRGPIGRVLPGSVGERLLAGSPCSVLVAPRGYAAQPHGRIASIGIAYDGEPESKHALRVAARLGATFDATLRIVAVCPPIQVPAPGRISSTSPGYARVLRKHFDEQLADAVLTLRGHVEVDPTLIEGDPVDSLVEQSQELDLLVIGSRGYGPIRRVLLGGVAGGVIRKAACPVMVIPRSAELEEGDEGVSASRVAASA
jgi:nucleotide-binding universal stress UspA family protein